MIHRLSSFLSLILVLLLAAPAVARDNQEMSLTDTVLTVSQDHLLLFTTLTNPLTDEQVQGLHNGIDIKIIFYIELNQVQAIRGDKNLSTLEIEHTLSYNTLKQEYRLERSNQAGRAFVLPELDMTLQAAGNLSNIRVIELNQLAGSSSYRLRLKAVIAKKQLPMNLHYLTNLFPWGDRETDWQTVEFTY